MSKISNWERLGKHSWINRENKKIILIRRNLDGFTKYEVYGLIKGKKYPVSLGGGSTIKNAEEIALFRMKTDWK